MNFKNKKIHILLIIVIILCINFITIVSDEKIENNMYKNYEKITSQKLEEKDMKKLIRDLKNKNEISELKFIQGFNFLKQNKLEEAKLEFKEALLEVNTSTNYLSKVYIHKYLAVIAIKQDKHEEARLNIKASFKNIDSQYYNESINLIINIVDMCKDLNYLRNEGIDILNNILKNKVLNNESRLLALEELSLLYFMNNQYANSSEENLNYIFLAKEMGRNKEHAYGIVYLSTIFTELKGNETAIKTIQEALEIKIDDKVEDSKFKAYAYLNLGEIYVHLDRYQEALDSIKEVENHKEYYSQEDYRDFEILSNIVKIRSYINLDKLDEAEKLIKTTDKLLQIDKKEYFINKKISYEIAKAEYFNVKGDFKNALEEYTKAYNTSEMAGSLYNKVLILESIVKIYKETHDFNKYYEYSVKLDALKNYSENLRYEDYSNYIVNSTVAKKKILSNYEFKINMYKVSFILITIIVVIYYAGYKQFIKMAFLVQKDALTNVYNRRQFDKMYKKSINDKKNFACIMIDIDNFKNINDTYGHDIGDYVLLNVSNAIELEIDKSCGLYRYGGEEFVVLLYDKTEEEIIYIAEKVRKKVNSLDLEQGLKVSISLGVSRFEIDGENVLKKADENLYEAKKTGKNKVVYRSNK